jgi:hypothetical protein
MFAYYTHVFPQIKPCFRASCGSALWVGQRNGGRPPVDLASSPRRRRPGGRLPADAAFGPLLTGDRRVVTMIVVASEEFFARAAPV